MATIYWNDDNYTNIYSTYIYAGMTHEDDVYYGYNGYDVYDYVQVGGGSDTVYMYGGNDHAVIWHGSHTVYGGNGEDRFSYISSANGNNILYGDAGKDIFTFHDVGAAIEGTTQTLYGGSGADTFQLTRESSSDYVNINANIYAYADSGNDNFNAYNDSLIYTTNMYGGAGDNAFTLMGSGLMRAEGGAGRDYIVTPVYDDVINANIFGGADRDYISVRTLLNVNDFSLGTTIQTIDAGTGHDVIDHLSGLSAMNPEIMDPDTFIPGGSLHGGAGNDFYIIRLVEGKGADHIIYDQSGSDDRLYVELSYDYTSGRTIPFAFDSLNREGTDLILVYKDSLNVESTITVQNYYGACNGNGHAIEFIHIGDLASRLNFPDTNNDMRNIGDSVYTGYTNLGLSDNVTSSIASYNDITGTNSSETLNGTSGNDALYGLEGDDVINGAAGDDLAIGGNGNDTLNGDDGDDYLHGCNGDDTFYGGAGNDEIDGGNGSDTLDYSAAAAGVTVDVSAGIASDDGDGGSDIFVGIENVIGSAYADIITGSSSDNILSAGDGDDILDGGAGIDILLGGAGDDEYIYDLSSTLKTIDDASGSADAIRLGAGIVLADLTFTNVGDDLEITFAGSPQDKIIILGQNAAGTKQIESIIFSDSSVHGLVASSVIAGTSGDDTLVGTSGNDIFTPFGGDDNIDGVGGNDTVSYETAGGGVIVNFGTNRTNNDGDGGFDILASIENATGSAFNDTLRGDAVANILIGNAGADKLYGYAGNDTLYGGDGIDSLYGHDGDDVVYGDAGNDLISGDVGNDTLYGGGDNDRLYGGDDDDTLYGDGGSDHLYGDAGADTLYGGDGLDNFWGGAGNDILYGGADRDSMRGGDGNDTLYGGEGNDVLYGEDGDDTMYGGDGNDTIIAGTGNNIMDGGDGFDKLYGEGGNDTLYARSGGDYLYGRGGDDTFIVDDITDFASSGDVNYITNNTGLTVFDSTDVIDIKDVIDYSSTTDVLSDFVSVTESSNWTSIQVDKDGTGTTHSMVEVLRISQTQGVWSDADDMVSQGNLIVE